MEAEVLAQDDFIFKEIADYTYDWESWIDPQGSTRWVNPAVERITGYTVAECLAHADYPLFLVHKDDRMRVSDALEHARRHISGNDLEFRIAHKNGFIRWGAISWQDLLDRSGSYRGFRTSVRDITDRKVHEVELLASRDEAHRANRAKSEFLATMSHEIRTPIQNILGCTQLLAQTPLAPSQAPLIDVMSSQGELLLHIVDDVLDFTALQSAQLRMEKRPLFLLREVQMVVDAARASAESKNLSLTWHSEIADDIAVVGDSHRLRQVLGNLVNNAIKFTEQGGVQISVKWEDSNVSDPDLYRVRFEVRDSGIGISLENQKTLFQPFHQIDPSISRRHGGSGLGLSICKRLVDLMDGSLQVQSAPDAGSTFFITIPFEIVRTDEALLHPKTVATPTTCATMALSILIIEDNEVARDVMVALLHSLGQRPDAAATGEQALGALKTKEYQLLLMDKRMSGMDGLTLTRLIRADRTLTQPYIVAVTANVLHEAQEACMAAGMDAFLGKPVRLADLERLMKKVEGRAVLRQQLGNKVACFDLEVLQDLQTVQSGGQSLLQKHAPSILSELKAAADYLSQHDPSADLQETQRWAHSLRGTLRTIGAKEAAQQLAALEIWAAGNLSERPKQESIVQAVLDAHDGLAGAAGHGRLAE